MSLFGTEVKYGRHLYTEKKKKKKSFVKGFIESAHITRKPGGRDTVKHRMAALSAETRARIQAHMASREDAHVRKMDGYASRIEQLASAMEQKKVAFKSQLGIRDAQSLARAVRSFEEMRSAVRVFIDDIERTHSQALDDVDGVVFDEPKSISKKVERRKRRVRERVEDLTKVAQKLHASLDFARNLESFDNLLEQEQQENARVAGKEICPFCREYVSVQDWISHAVEAHGREKRMDMGVFTRREAFDAANAREEAGRRGWKAMAATNSQVAPSSTPLLNPLAWGGRRVTQPAPASRQSTIGAATYCATASVLPSNHQRGYATYT